MFLIIGIVVVIACTIGGYAAMGGKLYVLWQPFELVIIGGAAVGAYLVANSKQVLAGTMGGLGKVAKGPAYGKKEYLELLCVLYQIFKLAKTKGMLALESHVEKPEESSIFTQFPSFLKNHHATEFFCDYLRLVTLGSDKPYELEALMDEEIEGHHTEAHEIPHALQTMADGMPALGIVAAVLGVIKTMGAISEPPEVLGKLIGAALVGTFLGVWLSYGFIGPMANSLGKIEESDGKYLQAIKVGLIAHLHGFAPSISIEYARKAIGSAYRPGFAEVEEATGNLQAP